MTLYLTEIDECSPAAPTGPTGPIDLNLPSWLAEVAASGRFSDPSCNETRSMKDLAIERRGDKNYYVAGGLRSHATRTLASWMCIANHPCLQAVGASHDDRMCYAVERNNATSVTGVGPRFHAWGLDSELKLVSQNCAA